MSALSLAGGMAVAVLVPLLVAMAPVVAFLAISSSREHARRMESLRRRERGLASWERP